MYGKTKMLFLAYKLQITNYISLDSISLNSDDEELLHSSMALKTKPNQQNRNRVFKERQNLKQEHKLIQMDGQDRRTTKGTTAAELEEKEHRTLETATTGQHQVTKNNREHRQAQSRKPRGTVGRRRGVEEGRQRDSVGERERRVEGPRECIPIS